MWVIKHKAFPLYHRGPFGDVLCFESEQDAYEIRDEDKPHPEDWKIVAYDLDEVQK